jgi:predicted enzyme related to lactoylglutathione lyase
MLHARRIATIAVFVSTLAGLSTTALSQNSASVRPSYSIAVAPQYDTTHVYVNPSDVNAFVASFLGTFGGTTTKQVSVTVTPTPSTTTSQLLQTPVGTVSLFGFTTPIPSPFGAERTGYLVNDMDAAIKAARATGADVVVTPFPDPIGMDAVIQWPGGVMTQIYWHITKPSYVPFARVPENRVYVSADRADVFVKSFLAFSNGQVVSDKSNASGTELGLLKGTIRRIQVESPFGKLLVFVTDGHLPYPYGRETTGYEVEDLGTTLEKASALGVKVLVPPGHFSDRTSAMVEFPGGYIAEIHSIAASTNH